MGTGLVSAEEALAGVAEGTPMLDVRGSSGDAVLYGSDFVFFNSVGVPVMVKTDDRIVIGGSIELSEDAVLYKTDRQSSYLEDVGPSLSMPSANILTNFLGAGVPAIAAQSCERSYFSRMRALSHISCGAERYFLNTENAVNSFEDRAGVAGEHVSLHPLQGRVAATWPGKVACGDTKLTLLWPLIDVHEDDVIHDCPLHLISIAMMLTKYTNSNNQVVQVYDVKRDARWHSAMLEVVSSAEDPTGRKYGKCIRFSVMLTEDHAIDFDLCWTVGFNHIVDHSVVGSLDAFQRRELHQSLSAT